MINVAKRDKVLREGGPGIAQSDLPMIKKTDLEVSGFNINIRARFLSAAGYPLRALTLAPLI